MHIFSNAALSEDKSKGQGIGNSDKWKGKRERKKMCAMTVKTCGGQEEGKGIIHECRSPR